MGPSPTATFACDPSNGVEVTIAPKSMPPERHARTEAAATAEKLHEETFGSNKRAPDRSEVLLRTENIRGEAALNPSARRRARANARRWPSRPSSERLGQPHFWSPISQAVLAVTAEGASCAARAVSSDSVFCMRLGLAWLVATWMVFRAQGQSPAPCGRGKSEQRARRATKCAALIMVG